MNALRDPSEILSAVAKQEEFELFEYSPLSGGSINEVFLLKTSEGEHVLKLNSANAFPRMFPAEKEGLAAIERTKTIAVPKVDATGKIAQYAYLLMEHEKEGKPVPEFWNIFAKNLAALHKNTAANCGFSTSNYIGSLQQFNTWTTSASGFYIEQRLEPQLKMAAENGFSFRNLDRVFKNISEEIPEEKPALIHGDLWSGNYLVNHDGLPCLIDPAVCYAPREMDLCMMKLFGGFPSEVFSVYSEIFPLEPGFNNRIQLWQLYYLLVHLNIFGQSYFQRVKNILDSYT